MVSTVDQLRMINEISSCSKSGADAKTVSGKSENDSKVLGLSENATSMSTRKQYIGDAEVQFGRESMFVSL